MPSSRASRRQLSECFPEDPRPRALRREFDGNMVALREYERWELVEFLKTL